MSSASSGVASFSPTMCFLGTMSTCVGACGLMSSKTNTLSSSYTFFAVILPAMILQKRQLSIRMSPLLRLFIPPRQQVRANELIQIAVKHAVDVADFFTRSQVFHHAIWLQHVGPDL